MKSLPDTANLTSDQSRSTVTPPASEAHEPDDRQHPQRLEVIIRAKDTVNELDGARTEMWRPVQSDDIASPNDLQPAASVTQPRRIDTFRPWQLEAFRVCRNERDVVVQAPGGSGKSFMQVMLAQDDTERNGSKQLIAVPQNHIHHSFLADDSIEFTLPGSSKPSRWAVQHNFCDCVHAGRHLKSFLLAAAPSLDCLAAITTHTCLVQVWKRLSKSEKRRALKNTSFRIDEAHHISNVFHEDEMALYNVKEREAIIADATRLGAFVRYAVSVDDPTCKLHLTTATFFRGDRKTIISQAIKERFVHFELPCDEYYKTLGIERLEFDFVTYDGNPIAQVVRAVAEEPNEKHLVIIPALTTRFRTRETLDRLTAALRKVVSPEKVLDLVTPSTQDQHKELLFRFPHYYTVIIACRLFDEGTDWVPCTRLHNTDAGERSLTLAVQRFFRPLRQHPTKKHVKIENYIPAFTPELELEEQRRVLSDRFNSVLASIITQGELMPVFIPLKSEVAEGKPPRTTLQDLYGERYVPALEDLLKSYELVEDKSDPAAVAAVAQELIEAYGVPDSCDPEDVKASWLGQLHRITTVKTKASDRASLDTKAFDASDIRKKGFDVVWARQPRGSALVWGVENIDAHTIRNLLRTIEPVPSLEEIRIALRAYHERTGSRVMCPGGRGQQHYGWFDELGRSINAMQRLCKRHYGTTLAKQMDIVLGTTSADLPRRLSEVFQGCRERGEPIPTMTQNAPIAELGLSPAALDARLTRYCETSFAKERDKVVDVPGMQQPNEYLIRIQNALRHYRDSDICLPKEGEQIPELGTATVNVCSWLHDHYGMSLSDLARDVWQEAYGPLVTTTEAAKRLGVSPFAVRSWSRSGRLNAVRFRDRTFLYRQAEVEQIKASKGDKRHYFRHGKRGPYKRSAHATVDEVGDRTR